MLEIDPHDPELNQDQVVADRIRTFSLCTESELYSAFTDSRNPEIRSALRSFLLTEKSAIPEPPATTLTPDQINDMDDSYLPKRNILIERSDPEEGASPEWIIHSTVIRTKNAIDPTTATNHAALETIIPKMADILTRKILSALHKKYMCMEIKDLCLYLGITERLLLRLVEEINDSKLMSNKKIKIHIRNRLIIIGPSDPTASNPLTLVTNNKTKKDLFYPPKKEETSTIQSPTTIQIPIKTSSKPATNAPTTKPPIDISTQPLHEVRDLRNLLARQYRDLQRKTTPKPALYTSPQENNEDKDKLLKEIRTLKDLIQKTKPTTLKTTPATTTPPQIKKPTFLDQIAQKHRDKKAKK